MPLRNNGWPGVGTVVGRYESSRLALGLLAEDDEEPEGGGGPDGGE